MVVHGADRALAGLARHAGFGLHGRGKAVQRRPVIGAGGAENAHGRRAERGRDMHQAGIVRDRDAGRRHRQNAVAQIGAGEVAHPRRRRRRRSPRPCAFSPGPPTTQTSRPLFGQKPRGLADNRSSAWRRRPSPAPAPRLCPVPSPLACRQRADFLRAEPGAAAPAIPAAAARRRAAPARRSCR